MVIKKRNAIVKSFILHIHPKKIDLRALKFNRTFGLGGMSALLIVVLFFTGLILRFSYIPTVAEAHHSIVNLQKNSVFGLLIRNLHHLASQLLIITTFLHLLRVYYSQSIYGIRAKNWIYGLILFLLVVVSNFTGYLLPWDQLSYWATTIFTQIIEQMPFFGNNLADTIRGGKDLNDNTLLRFYAIHTGVLPILFIVFMAIHFWLVRKAGGIALAKLKNRQTIDVYPYLVKLEIMVATILIAAILLISIFYDAPLQNPANPNLSPNPSKSPWYFLGIQELLMHLHPVFSTFIIPILTTAFLFYVPFFTRKNVNVGVWFNSEKAQKAIVYTAVFSFIFTFILIYILEHYLNLKNYMPNMSLLISNGLVPLLLYLVPHSMFIVYLKKILNLASAEFLMMISTSIFSSYICMTFISLFLRAEGMMLIF